MPPPPSAGCLATSGLGPSTTLDLSLLLDGGLESAELMAELHAAGGTPFPARRTREGYRGVQWALMTLWALGVLLDISNQHVGHGL